MAQVLSKLEQTDSLEQQASLRMRVLVQCILEAMPQLANVAVFLIFTLVLSSPLVDVSTMPSVAPAALFTRLQLYSVIAPPS